MASGAESLAAAAEGSQSVASNILRSYYAAAGGRELGSGKEADPELEEGLRRVQEHIVGAQSEAAACLICLEGISHTDAVWHCSEGCHEVVHLMCIQAWARQQLSAAQAKAQQRLNPERFPAAAAEAVEHAEWGCPKCRQPYPAAALPTCYQCYCGREVDPPFNPWNAPHSCGEACGRPNPACGHPCTLLCHPGPCPPCPRAVRASCHCRRVQAEKRCGRHSFSCGALCGRALQCGHACPEPCHGGACPPCALASSVACQCGAEERELPCSLRGVVQCERVCGRQLACGQHACTRRCHGGACGGCPLAGPKACPCGKVRLPGAACDAAVPPCGATCDKLLPCGLHHCAERCHAGPCPVTCRQTVERSCACGRSTKLVQCGTERLRCDRRCSSMRACGRHQCRRRCCDGDCPPCEEVCGRRLRCGNHRCPAPCHAGPCGPCPLSARIACACRGTSYSVPCGREGTAPPPRCDRPCPVPPLCRHAAALPQHRCHFGPCPAPAAGTGQDPRRVCTLPCGTALPCGHVCPAAACHDPEPPAVAEYQPPPPPTGLEPAGGGGRRRQEAPAAASAVLAAAEAQQLHQTLPRDGAGHLTPCPPCQAPVPVTCLGGHCTVQAPCSSARPFPCAAPCGRPLACGNHACQGQCHGSGEPCTPCALPCREPRACPHPCALGLCHRGPCPRCEAGVSLASRPARLA